MESGNVVVGKYRLNQLLGSGGMAEVWSATNVFTERHIAIKFMNVHLAKTPEAATRFLNEAKVSARINHPNIIDILDVGQTEDGQLFLVMELLTGFPLEVALRRQTPAMTLYEFTLVMLEVAQALAAAHKSGVVHRDLKPTNIFLHKVREGVAIPKVLDFGVSKFLEDDQNHSLTVAGTVLGSPLYMSPEQARGETNLDGRTDVFAFGAILFEALTGFRPYDAKNFNALIIKIATSQPKSIDECAPTTPECLRKIVRACLEPDLEERIATFDEVVERIRAALPELMDSTASLPTPSISTSLVDPEATNALPVVRASDRPNAGSVSGIVPGASGGLAASIPGPTGPSWNTPNTSYASVNTHVTRLKYPTWMIVSAGGALVLALVTGGLIGWQSRGTPTTAAAPPSVAIGTEVSDKTPMTSRSLSKAPATPNSDVATVSVDSLPGAAKPLGPIPRGFGRLVIASGIPCTLSSDGKALGSAPALGLDLPAGAHLLKCDAPNGKSRTSHLTIHEGATQRIKFTFDD